MDDKTRRTMLKWVSRAKDYLSKKSDFFNDVEARGLFCVLLTMEGSIMFGDVEELGHVCVEFCKRKQRDAEEMGLLTKARANAN